MYVNYILYNTQNGTTYNGCTNDMAKRLRQHNGEISGGARSTRRFAGLWQVLAVVESPTFTTKSAAMSFEWWIRYPTGRKPRPREFSRPNGRLMGLAHVLDRFGGADLFQIQLADGFVLPAPPSS